MKVRATDLCARGKLRMRLRRLRRPERNRGSGRKQGCDELVCLGLAVGVFCRTNSDFRESWRGERELQSGDGNTDGGGFYFCVVCGVVHKDPAAWEHRAANLDLSPTFGVCHRAVVVVLFPGAAIGGSFAGGSGG